VRETRLALAEELNRDLKENISALIGSIDELDKTIEMISRNTADNRNNPNKEMLTNLVKPISEKVNSVRKHIAVLDARVEKTINEWDNLKKDGIGLPSWKAK
jgi:chromosome segregation ATPase